MAFSFCALYTIDILLWWLSSFAIFEKIEFVIGGINALEALGKILTSANLTLKDWGVGVSWWWPWAALQRKPQSQTITPDSRRPWIELDKFSVHFHCHRSYQQAFLIHSVAYVGMIFHLNRASWILKLHLKNASFSRVSMYVMFSWNVWQLVGH